MKPDMVAEMTRLLYVKVAKSEGQEREDYLQALLLIKKVRKESYPVCSPGTFDPLSEGL